MMLKTKFSSKVDLSGFGTELFISKSIEKFEGTPLKKKRDVTVIYIFESIDNYRFLCSI